MEMLLDLALTMTDDILPDVVSILLISFSIFAFLLFISYRTKEIITSHKWLWLLQALVFLVIIKVTRHILILIDPHGVDMINVAMQVQDVLMWLASALLIHQAMVLFVWNGIYLKKYKAPPPILIVGLISASFFLFASYGIITFIFKQPITGLVVSSGIVAAVIGLAMQNSLSDLIAGVAISVERPFKIGDWIELEDGTCGEVVEVNWRATHIKSWRNSIYILPNARISDARIHNHSLHDSTYAFATYVHIPSTVPPALVRRVLLQACVEASSVLNDPPPMVRIAEAGGSYKYMVFVYFESFPAHFAGKSELLLHIWIQCARHGITPSAVTNEVIYRKGISEEISGPSPEELISDVPLFAELSEEDQRHLVSHSKIHNLSMDQEIISQGDEGTSIFVISSGMVRVSVSTENAGAKEVAKLTVGNYFGEMSLLAHEPRSATVIAHTDCQLLEIDWKALKSIIDEQPELIDSIAHVVSERNLMNQSLKSNISTQDLTARLIKLAASLSRKMRKIFKV